MKSYKRSGAMMCILRREPLIISSCRFENILKTILKSLHIFILYEGLATNSQANYLLIRPIAYGNTHNQEYNTDDPYPYKKRKDKSQPAVKRYSAK
jgi:hypothetical protein